MALYDDFYDSLLPGNYALTKSMELTKVSDSGTLWYTKKFLTLYYFVFLSNDIMTLAYRDKVVEIFDNFIASVDPTVRDAAERYFYPENEAINFKSPNFNYFSNFASATGHANQAALNEYYQSAKKYYFSLLMGSGGQTGVKKQLKEAVQRPGFVYSHSNIDAEITRASINSCMRDANSLHRISDNSVKYIISQEASDYICRLSSVRAVDEADIRQAMIDYPHESPKYRMIESDVIAFIRNERQILYYYGYFHSKTSGATDFEFSSLTPVGELAIRANYYEFLAIWEHQKVKMVSQPVTVDINYINGLPVDSAKFDISTTPYTDILDSLIRRNSFSLDEYKYVISRRKDVFDAQSWSDEEESLFSNVNTIKNRVNGFGRQRDKQDEDARKELLKYLLGIRSDMGVDAGTNPLSIVDFSRSKVTVQENEPLLLLYSIYSKLDDYKKLRYSSVYDETRDDLKNRYEKGLRGITAPINARSKIHWDLYNIHPDKFIMLGTVVAIAAISLHYTEIENAGRDAINNLCQFVSDKFSSLLRKLGIRYSQAISDAYPTIISSDSNESIQPRQMRKLNFIKYDTTSTPSKELRLDRKKGTGLLISTIIERFNQETSFSFLNNEQVDGLTSFINDYLKKIRSFRDYSIKATIAPNPTDMLTNLFYLSDGNRKIETTGSGVQYMAMASIYIICQIMELYKSKCSEVNTQWKDELLRQR